MQTPLAVRRLAALIPTTSVALLLGFAVSPAVLAHNTLISSTPEDGAELDSAPDEVTLTFNDKVQEGAGSVTEEDEDGNTVERESSANAIVVTGPDDQTYEDGDVRIDAETVSVDLRPLEMAGEHTIAYRILSADGHPVDGELTFTLAESGVSAESKSGDENGESDDSTDSAGADESDTDATTGPMSMFGPVGAVVGGIAVVALIIILVVRMRSRPGQGEQSE